ncbi:murein biosynthesis integral membrane protein MurJ [Aeromicrobium sp. 636]|uniref:Murein biosynthesis integral membrane protein MurJ n=1 Tax=Aeromicrobium senzhongii TaxID=2663859 RepID=A0A8I0K105_9ACTN|nr:MULTISPECIES: murein biosynthesis integral membrane protein MurJ [Aeromicrobium]MBC9226941.1 murein biosynthesis integral membrane protein MurJ [Aeromicrobium senzhongii]MCQ3999041.1 murein biosynthesis integral membrane protein MurJ [Aeromicrobium sp. 636]
MSDPNLARSSAWMALGTIVSRVTGLLRSLVLLAVIGSALNGSIFNVSNSIPNSLYILVAGGIFNVVLVPQLVRAMKNDPDGGEAYANRIVTLGLLVLGVATIALMIAVPLLVRMLFGAELFTEELTRQRESAQLLMLLCMPQVFFYGAFVLVGQILNSRQRFGPMMWAPIVNNLVALGVLGTYAVVFGVAQPGAGDGFSSGEAWLLGLGSTLGIAVQALVLVPFLRQVGFRYRPRFDFRGVGLSHTLKLGAWTLAFIVVNQISFFVIVRLASGADIEGRRRGVDSAGQVVYDVGFLISQVPHGVITVSLATAIIPTLAARAAERDFGRMRLELTRTLRLALMLIAPIAVAVACLGLPLASVVAGFGAARANTDAIGMTISAFALALVMFSLHYVVLRGFYALEDTRTPFFIQVAIAAGNIVLAVLLTTGAAPIEVSTRLALAYGLAYTLGLAISATVLSRRIGTLADPETVRFVARLALVCAAAAAVMLAGRWGWGHFVDSGALSPLSAMGELVVVGLLGAATTVLMARLLRVEELRYVVTSVLRRN